MTPASRPVTLTTERLRLEPLNATCLLQLKRLFNTSEVRKYLWNDQPLDMNQIEELHRTSMASFMVAGYGLWVCKEANGLFLGCVGLRSVGATDRVELLYAIEQDQWGKGYATEAVRAVIHFAFTTLGLTRIEASTHPSNTRSVALLRRIGMKRSDTDTTEAGFLAVYSLTPDQYTLSEPHV